MSEFQISLLVIGIAVVLAVYIYNWWQQRKLSRRFGSTFDRSHEDALYRIVPEKSEVQVLVETECELELPIEPVRTGVIVERRRWTRDCSLLDASTDYIAVLIFTTPAGADSLVPLLRKRFDFGKNVNICGLNEKTGLWERVVADSHMFYSAFKLSLQLADRSGPVSEVRISDFRDLARDIAAQLDAKADLPDVAAAGTRAQELDNFCVEVDQLIGLNILPSGERTFSGGEVARVAEKHGMSLQADGAFHLLDANRYTIFSLSNQEDIPFHEHTLGQLCVNGLTLLLDVPRVEHPTIRFDEMAVLARQLAMDLRAAVVDDHRVALGEPGLAQIREQIAVLESRMLAGLITPGSPQARRLFS
jgi:hypothetical protein